jgi:hypothetical protein
MAGTGHGDMDTSFHPDMLEIFFQPPHKGSQLTYRQYPLIGKNLPCISFAGVRATTTCPTN